MGEPDWFIQQTQNTILIRSDMVNYGDTSKQSITDK